MLFRSFNSKLNYLKSEDGILISLSKSEGVSTEIVRNIFATLFEPEEISSFSILSTRLITPFDFLISEFDFGGPIAESFFLRVPEIADFTAGRNSSVDFLSQNAVSNSMNHNQP